VPPPVLVGAGIVSVQLGAGLAARLFTEIPPAAVTGLRLWTSAVMLAAIGGRGLARTLGDIVRRRRWRDAGVAAAFGVALAVMNFSIYQSFARIPLGIAVTIEFLGPLAIAVVSSRHVTDLLWVCLAGLGVALLAHGGTTAPGSAVPGSRGGHGLAVSGIAFALVAAAAWAGYIKLSASTGRRLTGSSGLAIAMIIAALIVTPPAVAAGHGALLRPGVLAVIGLLSSVIPYRFELEALQRIPARLYGIWVSLAPAVAALIGLILLGESLAVREWAAVGCVVVASAGASRHAAGSAQAPQA
jgi:inner membrane transporter RhtA